MANNNIFDTLKTKALESNNKEIINLLASDEFKNSFDQVTSLLSQLNCEICDNEKSELDKEKFITDKIARTLSSNFFTVYYVNIKTGEYYGYSSIIDYRKLNIQESGSDFFKDVSYNIEKVIYKDDIEYIRKKITKENLELKTKENNNYTITYRILLNGTPTYISLTASTVPGETDYLIIGLSNVNKEKLHELELEHEIEEKITYSKIALTLAGNFISIYYVNVIDNSYIEYKIDEKNQILNQVSYGSNFFSSLQIASRRLIYNDDLEKFNDSLAKENLLKEINKHGSFKLNYRQLFDGKPRYTLLTALYQLNDKNHIVLATSDNNEQMLMDIEFKQKYAKEKKLARTDVLTGALNKYSYSEIEEILNNKIKKKELKELALVIADINDLKITNDTRGHEAGDKLIIDAKNILTETFKKSPVYRIGGDEFIIVLEGKDYLDKDKLLDYVKNISFNNIGTTNPVIAIGIAVFNPSSDNELITVFNRADQEMYAHKKYLKEI